MRGILYYFSGTGNTKWIADKLKSGFKSQGIDLQLESIEILEKITVRGYDFLVIGTPVYAGLSPKIVNDFLNKLPKVTKNMKAIVYSTQGAKSASASAVIAKKLEAKGYKVIIHSSIKMTNNYYFVGHKNVTAGEQKEILENAGQKIKTLIKYFIENKELKESVFFPRTLLSKISSKAFIRVLPKLSRSITTTEECTKCGICLRNCPKNNITFENGHAVFHSKCMLCLRCIYVCPENAIRYKEEKIEQIQKQIINCLNLRK